MKNLLQAADDAYYNGKTPIMSDAQYDMMKKEYQKNHPDDPYSSSVGAPVNKVKVKLPFQMGSLNQIYDDNDLTKWLKKYGVDSVHISEKLDGMSACIIYKNGKLDSAYTRGDGINGGLITGYVKHSNYVPSSISNTGYIAVRGELIIKKDFFEESFKDEFANPRNMVSGIFNRKTPEVNYLKHVDFIAYEIINNSSLTKSEEFSYLAALGFKIPEWKNTTINITVEELAALTNEYRQKSQYELDGIVITSEKYKKSENFTESSSLNPEYAMKFKIINDDEIVETTITQIEWNLSKHGYLKPRLHVKPVRLFGTTVTHASAFNAGMVRDMGLGAGAVIRITKAGAVIPYVVETLKTASDSMITKTPPEYKWSDKEVDLILIDAGNNSTVKFEQVLDFVNTLEVDNLKEGVLEKLFQSYRLYDKSYEDIIWFLVSISEIELTKAVGQNGTKIFNSISRRLSNLPMSVYLGSLKYFGPGFGVRRFSKILKNLSDHNNVWALSINDIVAMDGFDITTATAIVSGLPSAKALFDRITGYINIVDDNHGKTNELKDMSFVFTGFRDNDLQKKMEMMGATVNNSVSKKTSAVVCLDKNSVSGKLTKARQTGITILTIDELKDTYGL